jgi:hypothetical protein
VGAPVAAGPGTPAQRWPGRPAPRPRGTAAVGAPWSGAGDCPAAPQPSRWGSLCPPRAVPRPPRAARGPCGPSRWAQTRENPSALHCSVIPSVTLQAPGPRRIFPVGLVFFFFYGVSLSSRISIEFLIQPTCFVAQLGIGLLDEWNITSRAVILSETWFGFKEAGRIPRIPSFIWYVVEIFTTRNVS